MLQIEHWDGGKRQFPDGYKVVMPDLMTDTTLIIIGPSKQRIVIGLDTIRRVTHIDSHGREHCMINVFRERSSDTQNASGEIYVTPEEPRHRQIINMFRDWWRRFTRQ